MRTGPGRGAAQGKRGAEVGGGTSPDGSGPARPPAGRPPAFRSVAAPGLRDSRSARPLSRPCCGPHGPGPSGPPGAAPGSPRSPTLLPRCCGPAAFCPGAASAAINTPDQTERDAKGTGGVGGERHRGGSRRAGPRVRRGGRVRSRGCPRALCPHQVCPAALRDEAEEAGDSVWSCHLLRGRLLPLPDAGPRAARPRAPPERGELPPGERARGGRGSCGDRVGRGSAAAGIVRAAPRREPRGRTPC